MTPACPEYVIDDQALFDAALAGLEQESAAQESVPITSPETKAGVLGYICRMDCNSSGWGPGIIDLTIRVEITTENYIFLRQLTDNERVVKITERGR